MLASPQQGAVDRTITTDRCAAQHCMQEAQHAAQSPSPCHRHAQEKTTGHGPRRNMRHQKHPGSGDLAQHCCAACKGSAAHAVHARTPNPHHTTPNGVRPIQHSTGSARVCSRMCCVHMTRDTAEHKLPTTTHTAPWSPRTPCILALWHPTLPL